MATALVSLISGRPVKADVGMTGEITLRGQVMPVGGIKEKMLAAHRSGLKTAIIPTRNQVDLEDLPEDQKKSVGFIETGTRGLFDSEDAATFYEGMVPGSAIVALAIEHAWAVALVNAIANSGVEMAINFRVPAFGLIFMRALS
jgi:predicted S18 family serine protease